MDKNKYIENEIWFLKDWCEQQKHLLYVITRSHEGIKSIHDEFSVANENSIQDHAFLTNKISNEEIKISDSSSCRLDDQLQNIANPCDVCVKENVPTHCNYLLAMPCC